MDITVAICTWNRADLLDKTLGGLRRLNIPAGTSWELIVVNNNCSDNTDAVIEKHLAFLPLKRVFEPKQGLSNARNAAVHHAQGRYILWTDDDVLVDPEWLTAYVTAFERWPEAVVFGGKVLPWFESAPPSWLAENINWLGAFYALRDFGNRELALPPGENPYGANVAFRTDQLRLHPFNPNLGRKGKTLAGGEETEVINKLRSAGSSVIWIPESIVKHYVPLSRMRLKYLRDYHYNQGIYQSGKHPTARRVLFGFSPWLFKQWLWSEYRYLTKRVLRPDSAIWLKAMIDASNKRGVLMAASSWHKI